MGNDVTEVTLPSPRTLKVHARMCWELHKLVIKVINIFPEIEAARPRCSSGIEALCLLNNGKSKAMSLLLHCSESSKFYLALTGDAILSKCKKARDLMAQSLSQIQNMVPVMLAAKISRIVMDLRSAAFCLDPVEEEAGKVLRDLIHGYGSTIDSSEVAAEAIQIALSRLHITSQKSLLIEKRSIKKLIDKFGESERSKKKILLLFLSLLNKHGKNLPQEHKDHDLSENKDGFPFSSSEVELRVNYRFDETEITSKPVPPEEFICFLSSRLMYDPVVIVSGQTYERVWIQKWFDEGNNTCPKTKSKLAHFSFTSNNGMKDLIKKWCFAHNVSFPESQIQEPVINSWDTSMNSIASLSSSMNALNISFDFSNLSIGSNLDSDLSYTKTSVDVKPEQEIDLEFLSKLSSLPWDSRCDAIEQMKETIMPSEDFIQLLLYFLKDARDFDHVESQLTGCLLLSEFLQKHRNSITYLREDAYDLFASFLDTVAAKLALSILEVLSHHENCGYEIKKSTALSGILNIIESQAQELLEPALKILRNLSSNPDICSFIEPSNLIPKLIPFLQDNTFATHCVAILKNLCEDSVTRVSIVETHDCIPSIVKLLENENLKDQEHAVYILLSFCSQRVEYCKLVMDEGIIPSLVVMCVNGNGKAKAMAVELLRILKDEMSMIGESSELDVMTVPTKEYKDEKHPKRPGLFRKFFSAKKKK